MLRSETDWDKHNLPHIELQPVGVVRNQSKQSGWDAGMRALSWQDRAARMKAQSQSVSELIINPDLEGILDGIEGFSHLMVLYWPHLIPDERRRVMKVHPLGCTDFPLVGTFATRSPVRPNSILVTVVRLIERNGHTLKVTGLDALDGSPVLDIKPYSRDAAGPDSVKVPDWMQQIRSTFDQ